MTYAYTYMATFVLLFLRNAIFYRAAKQSYMKLLKNVTLHFKEGTHETFVPTSGVF